MLGVVEFVLLGVHPWSPIVELSLPLFVSPFPFVFQHSQILILLLESGQFVITVTFFLRILSMWIHNIVDYDLFLSFLALIILILSIVSINL